MYLRADSEEGNAAADGVEDEVDYGRADDEKVELVPAIEPEALWPEGDDFEGSLCNKDGREHQVDVLEQLVVVQRSRVEVDGHRHDVQDDAQHNEGVHLRAHHEFVHALAPRVVWLYFFKFFRKIKLSAIIREREKDNDNF